jgi:Heterokaryon incompatibility protein (HET)
LLESNQQQFAQGIEFETLPKTFQHAVIATARLGFHHLWIDSLCIIQDSPADWETESAIMGDIYRGSECTIAASGAEDCHGALFAERNPLLTAPCRVTDKLGVAAPLRRTNGS